MDRTSLPFTIEDNVLVGKQVPIHNECTNIGALVLERMRSMPNFVAQVQTEHDTETTFAEMTKKSVKCALWLQQQGIQPGDIIGICIHNHPDSYVPLLAALYVGAIVNPWDDQLSTISASYFFSQIKPKIIFVSVEYSSKSAESLAEVVNANDANTKLVVFTELSGFLSLNSILQSQDNASEVNEFECVKLISAEQIATIVWSSGTSGLPKGVKISHASMINYMNHVKIHDLQGHVSMWTPTMRWYCGLFIIIKAILDCSKRIIPSDYMEDDEKALCCVIEKYEVSWFRCDCYIPIRLIKFDILNKYKLPTLKVFLFGGSPFSLELQRIIRKHLPHTDVILSYGMTDYGGLCTRQTKYSKPGSCGFVCETGRLKVVSPIGKILEANKTGEIWAKSSYMMNGYYNNPEATRKALDSDGWLHTGDLGYYNHDGEVFLTDRMSEFINYRGIKLSPTEIEALIQQHPAVFTAAVVPMPHAICGEIPVAFITTIPSMKTTEIEIYEMVEENMPWYYWTHMKTKILKKMPRTVTGKIDRRKLRQCAESYIDE